MPPPYKLLPPQTAARWPALLVWLGGWGFLWGLEETLSLGNLALLLVLASAIASVWLPATASVAASAIFVLLFNWYFIEPRFTFNVNLHQDLLLLVTMMAVSTVISYIMTRLRILVDLEAHHARTAEKLRTLSDKLRDNADIADQVNFVQSMLASETDCDVSMYVVNHHDEQRAKPDWRDKDIDKGLQFCASQSAAIGWGTGRYENLPMLCLPLRGRAQAYGAVALRVDAANHPTPPQREVLQQICDVFGMELERSQTMQAIQQAKQDAQEQSLRSTLLTSISHDFRTPLANLMSAISAIEAQAPQLSTDKIIDLAAMALSEAQHLNRMTTNTLQLARLDATPLQIKKDWESVPEILASVIAKTRQRHPQRQLVLQAPSDLPLIYCDAILLAQLFDNLLENAIKYSPAHTPIDIQVRVTQDGLETRVLDCGPGIPDAWKERVFGAFERVHEGPSSADASHHAQVRRGVGIGLAVCKAIAKVHDAKVWAEDRLPNGAALCVWLPVAQQPNVIPES